MDEYISREAVINITAETGAWETQNRVRELPAADVQPVNQWISVKDRLPENCIEVLVYDTDCGIVIGWYDKEIGDFAADFISPLDVVTHWMPLPEPPVRHGRWESSQRTIETGTVYCSNCAMEYYISDLQTVGDCNGIVHYCPNCGARMDLKDGEE